LNQESEVGIIIGSEVRSKTGMETGRKEWSGTVNQGEEGIIMMKGEIEKEVQ